MEVRLDIAEAFEQPGAFGAESAGFLRTMAGAAAIALAKAGAAACSVTLRQIDADAYLSIMSDEGADALDAAAVAPASQAIELAGGQVSIGRFEGAVTITAELPGAPAEQPPNVVQLPRAPEPPEDEPAEEAPADPASPDAETTDSDAA
jgi:hypothetical protein